MRRLFAITFFIIILLTHLPAFSEEGISISKDEKNLYLNIKIPVKNTAEFQKRLSSGLSNKIVVSIQIRDKKTNKEAIQRDYVLEAIYNVWDEKYRIFIYEPSKRLILETSDKDEVYKRIINQERIFICENSSLHKDSIYQIKVKIIVNPVSKEIIEKIKEYLADPEVTGLGSPTRTIFGSFANTFIPDLNTEKVIKYEIKAFSIGENLEKK
jgi:hypothetical protein